MLNTTHYVA